MEQTVLVKNQSPLSDELRTELIRKSVHILIAAVPSMTAFLGTALTLGILATGIVLYTTAEALRQRGCSVPIITHITRVSSRSREANHFVLGPVTLGIGAMLAIMLYPHPAASIAVYALAFGDSAASVAGKFLGRLTIPLTGGKTLAGSLACTVVVALTVAIMLQGQVLIALALGITAALLEALPTRDADNLLLPVGVGLAATLIL